MKREISRVLQSIDIDSSYCMLQERQDIKKILGIFLSNSIEIFSLSVFRYDYNDLEYL